MQTIPFTDLPGTTRLFIDYLEAPERLRDFFEHDRRDGKKRLEQLASWMTDREAVSRILSQQARRWNAPAAVQENIAGLRRPTTFAVVTGQQMGLFGGPLYTLYKALATVLYCREFKARYPSYDFVPVFWMELEDHDFDEIRRTKILAQSGELAPMVYDAQVDHHLRRPVYQIYPTAEITALIDRLVEAAGTTDFTSSWSQALRDAYRPENSFSDAFARWMTTLLGEFGLILMDPSDPEFKTLAAPVFRREIDRVRAIHTVLTETSDALKKSGYHAQVETAGSNLFLLLDPPLETPFAHESTLKLRLDLATVETYGDFLKSVLSSEPHRFIPNVVLRPMVQDTLLPTFAYIGGPSEIAYFAQFLGVYRTFEMSSPLILARPFVTVVEKKIGKILDKFNLNLQQLMMRSKTLVNDIALSESPLPGLFAGWRSTSKSAVENVQAALVRIDPSLKGASETALQRIEHAIQVLEGKATEAQKRQSEVNVRQIQKAIDHLYPHERFQEREMNVTYFLNKYGFEFIRHLERSIRLDTTGHQVVTI